MLELDGQQLTLGEVARVARGEERVSLAESTRERLSASRRVVERIVAESRVVYGVNTGFGKLSDVIVPPDELRELQLNLVRSHSCGVGQPLSEEETRAMMLLRANVLAKGFSGARTVVVETLLALIERGVRPVVPEIGSVGASGDLAPLSHLALCSVGEGEAFYEGERMPGGEPQVHGACRDALAHARSSVEIETGGATDNPLVFAETGEVISGGNFHGAPLALAFDYACIALVSLGNIVERRVDRLVNPDENEGLPPFLTAHAGVESGYMVPQIVAVALLNECKVLAHPASVDNLPTDGGKEDHVSMGMTAAVKLRRVVENVERVVAIELLASAEALEYRAPLQPGRGARRAYETLRSHAPRLTRDRSLAPDIERVAAALRRGEFDI